MTWFPCPYLGVSVQLTPEREAHIRAHHPDADDVLVRMAPVLASPETIMRDVLTGVLLLARLFDFGEASRHIVAIVVRDEPTGEAGTRFWVVTAYSARRLPGEGRRWQKA